MQRRPPTRPAARAGKPRPAAGRRGRWSSCACGTVRRRGYGNMRMEIVLSMASDFPFSYKAALLSAIETIDLEKVGQAIETLRRARGERRRVFVCADRRRAPLPV